MGQCGWHLGGASPAPTGFHEDSAFLPPAVPGSLLFPWASIHNSITPTCWSLLRLRKLLWNEKKCMTTNVYASPRVQSKNRLILLDSHLSFWLLFPSSNKVLGRTITFYAFMLVLWSQEHNNKYHRIFNHDKIERVVGISQCWNSRVPVWHHLLSHR